MKNLRKDVTFNQKFHYLSAAINAMTRREDAKWKTDVIGLACQCSSQPKLKREDFDGMLDMTLKEIANKLNLK
jgi:hypothetical protein